MLMTLHVGACTYKSSVPSGCKLLTLRMSKCVLTQTIHSSLSLIGLVQLSGPTLCIPTHYQKALKLVCSAEQYLTHLEAALS